MKNFLATIKKHPYKTAMLIIAFLTLIVAIMSMDKKQTNTAVTNGDNSPAIAGNNAPVNIEYKQINEQPLGRTMEIGIENFLTINKTMRNVKFILPLNKIAYINEMKRGEKYTIFYTNNDLSDVTIPEKYRTQNNFEDNVCWIATLLCDRDSCQNTLELGPKGINGPNKEECYEM